MTYDVFISYCHRDNMVRPKEEHGWVDLFEQALTHSITEFLGRSPKIFRDDTMPGNTRITPTVYGNLEKSLVLVTILSPNFLTSEWCPKELAFFSRKNMKLLDSDCQIFPVVKHPVDSVPKQLEDIKKHEFFSGKGKNLTLFRPDCLGPKAKHEFYKKIDVVAREIAEYIKGLPDGRDIVSTHKTESSESANKEPIIYLAEPSPDLWDDYEKIRQDLEGRGNEFLPLDLTRDTFKPGSKPASADLYKESIQNDVEKSGIIVNLIGKDHTGFPKSSELSYQQIQMDLSAKHPNGAAVKRLIWIPQDLRDVNPEQEKFISAIKGLEKNEDIFQNTNEDVFQNTIENFKSSIQEALKPEIHDDPPGSLTWVYVLYEKSDLDASMPVEQMLHDKYSIFRTRAYLERALASKKKVSTYKDHQKWLTQCDAVLIYWKSAPETWVINNLYELDKIKPKRKRNFRAKAVFCDRGTPAEKRIDLLPQMSTLLKVKGYDELSKFTSQLEKRNDAK